VGESMNNWWWMQCGATLWLRLFSFAAVLLLRLRGAGDRPDCGVTSLCYSYGTNWSLRRSYVITLLEAHISRLKMYLVGQAWERANAPELHPERPGIHKKTCGLVIRKQSWSRKMFTASCPSPSPSDSQQGRRLHTGKHSCVHKISASWRL
jgi:hypothetical protein